MHLKQKQEKKTTPVSGFFSFISFLMFMYRYIELCIYQRGAYRLPITTSVAPQDKAILHSMYVYISFECCNICM